MEQAIKIAIEGGYNYFGYTKESFDTSKHACSVALLDPLFWQALGKAMGWKYPESRDDEMQLNGEWVEKWVDFVVRLANGGDAESFFNELLK